MAVDAVGSGHESKSLQSGQNHAVAQQFYSDSR